MVALVGRHGQQAVHHVLDDVASDDNYYMVFLRIGLCSLWTALPCAVH